MLDILEASSCDEVSLKLNIRNIVLHFHVWTVFLVVVGPKEKSVISPNTFRKRK